MAMAMSFRKFEGSPEKRWNGLKKLIWRSFKLFLLGVATQGGGFPDPDAGTVGYDLLNVRWCGILQRIAFSYFVVGIIKLYVPIRKPENTRYSNANGGGSWSDLLTVYAYHWACVAVFVLLYLCLMFGTKVPSWTIAQTDISIAQGINGTVVKCDVRGSLDPACNAAGYYDRIIFGQAHLYQPGEKIRLPECSSCSPGQCPLEPESETPNWCWAPFDPEGTVTVACHAFVVFVFVFVFVLGTLLADT
jgi:heparan-alpha-glucosaminide N-acetyltransferase